MLILPVASTASMIAYAIVVAVFAVVAVGIRAWMLFSGRQNKRIDRLDDGSEHKDSIPLHDDSRRGRSPPSEA